MGKTAKETENSVMKMEIRKSAVVTNVTTCFAVYQVMLIVTSVRIPIARGKMNISVSSCFNERKIKVATLYTIASFLVEMRRIELLSENLAPRLSPSAVAVLTFPRSCAQQQA